jgi:hypothetical protein
MSNAERGLSVAYVKSVRKDAGSCWDCKSFYFIPGIEYGCFMDMIIGHGCEKKVSGSNPITRGVVKEE